MLVASARSSSDVEASARDRESEVLASGDDAVVIAAARDELTRHRPRSALRLLSSLRKTADRPLEASLLRAEALLELRQPAEALDVVEAKSKLPWEAEGLCLEEVVSRCGWGKVAIAMEAEGLRLEEMHEMARRWSRVQALGKLRTGRLESARADFEQSVQLAAAAQANRLKVEVRKLEVAETADSGVPDLGSLRRDLLSLVKEPVVSYRSFDGGVLSEDAGPVQLDAWGSLGVIALQELERLMAVTGTERDVARCADLCQPLRFFRRLSPGQSATFLRQGDLVYLPAAHYVFHQGDEVDWMYVIMEGAAFVEKRDPAYGPDPAIVASLYDGQVFGELGMQTGNSPETEKPTRSAAVVMQEDTILLRLDPEFYYQELTQSNAGAEQQKRLDLLQGIASFEGCKRFDLMPLASNIEMVCYRYDECILSPGQRPKHFYILAQGLCDLVVGRGENSFVASTLRPGSVFGLGALLDEEGHCSYGSNVSVVVSTAVVTLYLVTRRLLFFLPEKVQKKVLKKSKEQEDPISSDVHDLTRDHKQWIRQRDRIVNEFDKEFEHRKSRPQKPKPETRMPRDQSSQRRATSAGGSCKSSPRRRTNSCSSIGSPMNRRPRSATSGQVRASEVTRAEVQRQLRAFGMSTQDPARSLKTNADLPLRLRLPKGPLRPKSAGGGPCLRVSSESRLTRIQ